MSAPEADPAEPVPEEVMRRVAREEARAVYDEHTVTGPDGQEWSFNKLVERIGELEGGVGRRTYIKAAMALGYIAMGTAGTTAIMRAASQPAAAAATGEAGTPTDPIDKIYADEIGTSSNPITAITTDKLNNADFTTATDGQVLTKTATGSQVAFEAAAGGGATTLIESQSPSGVATADFTTGIDSDHAAYIFEISDLVPATDAVALQLQVSTDGGSTWKSGASAYGYVNREIDNGGNTATDNSTGASEVNLIRGVVGSAAGESAGFTVHLYDPSNASEFPHFDWIGVLNHRASTNEVVAVNGAGEYQTAEAIDGVRIKFGSGNIESGTIELIGVN